MSEFSHLDWHPGSRPTPDQWEARREIYAGIWGRVVGDAHSSNHGHVASLEKELERVFAAGAWVAAIVFACAVVEGFLSYHDIPRSEEHKELLVRHNLLEGWTWLRKRRNTLVHLDPESPGLSTIEYRNKRDQLQQDAERAIHVALSVFVLPSHYGGKLPARDVR
jgi:hypothetical protein